MNCYSREFAHKKRNERKKANAFFPQQIHYFEFNTIHFKFNPNENFSDFMQKMCLMYCGIKTHYGWGAFSEAWLEDKFWGNLYKILENFSDNFIQISVNYCRQKRLFSLLEMSKCGIFPFSPYYIYLQSLVKFFVINKTKRCLSKESDRQLGPFHFQKKASLYQSKETKTKSKRDTKLKAKIYF